MTNSVSSSICSTATSGSELRCLFKFLSPGCWDDIDIDAMFPKITEVILLSDPKQEEKIDPWTTRVINTLQLVRILINVKPNEWVVARLAQLQKLLTKPLKNESVDIQDSLHSDKEGSEDFQTMKPIIERILDQALQPLGRAAGDDLPRARGAV